MVWLIGCNGMLGREVARQLKINKIEFIGTGSEVDITNSQVLESYKNSLITKFYDLDNPSSKKNIEWIINCSAYTNVDKAEEEIEKANLINYQGPLNLARLSRQIGAKLIHISTDYVFNGKSNVPYEENNKKDALGVYGKSKSDGEDAIEKEMVQYYIIRTSWLYGFEGHNFVYTMVNAMNNHDSIKVVNDQFGCPTLTVDLANTIITLMKKNENAKDITKIPSYGIYHYTNEGQTTWYDFAKSIYKYGKKYKRILKNCQINSCTTQEFGSKVKRPHYSVLSKQKIKNNLNIKIPNWENSLKIFIKDKRFEIK